MVEALSRHPVTDRALSQVGALGHPTRIATVRLLVGLGDRGMAAGSLAARLGVRENALSPHLSKLVAAGLLTRRRAGREIRYAADIAGLSDLLGFLLEECCGGRPDLCAPVGVGQGGVR